MTSSWMVGANVLTENPTLALALVLGVGAFFLIFTRRRIARRQSQSSAQRRPAARFSPSAADVGRRGLQESMEKLLLELEELSREINSQVDTRLRALNLLIQEADQKIKELRRLQGLSDDQGPSVPEGMPPPREEPHPEVTSERYAKVYHLAERGLSVVEIARELDMLTGEVELILALRRTGPGPTGEGA